MLGLSNRSLASKSIYHLWSLGFGNVSSETLIDLKDQFSKGVILSILVSNSPQVVLTFLYFTYNGIFICMLLAREWSGYAEKRKTLRVSSPKERQRATYRLQLPYSYGIPLLILSGVLHWLVSQSLFFVRIIVLDPTDTEVQDLSKSTCGYSPIAIILVIVLGAFVVLFGIANGFRKYEAGMPLVGSCSAAISAACHRPEEDVHASMKPLVWGAVDKGRSGPVGSRVGHCSFTSFKVDPPVRGGLYAGLGASEGPGIDTPGFRQTHGTSKGRADILP